MIFRTIRNDISLFTKRIRLKGNKKFLAFASFAITICSCSTFLIGALSNGTRKEEASYRFAYIAKHDSFGGDYCTAIIEKKEGSKKSLPSPYDEFLQLSGLFRKTDFVYASTYNAGKKQTIVLEEYDTTINQTILRADRFSNRLRSDGTYTQETYPLSLFFEGEKTKTGDYSWCYISETQAKKILIARGIDPVKENYAQLISTSTKIWFDNDSYTITIGNVFLEEGRYFDNLKKVIGDFVLMPPKAPDGFESQACYFFTSFPYQNSFYLERMYAIYDVDSFSIDISDFNLKNVSNVQKCIKAYYHTSPHHFEVWFWILIFTIFCLFLLLTLFLYKKEYLSSLGNCLLFLFCFLMSFYIFRIVFLVSESVVFFSKNSLVCFAIQFVIFVIAIVIYKLISIRRSKNA